MKLTEMTVRDLLDLLYALEKMLERERIDATVHMIGIFVKGTP